MVEKWTIRGSNDGVALSMAVEGHSEAEEVLPSNCLAPF